MQGKRMDRRKFNPSLDRPFAALPGYCLVLATLLLAAGVALAASGSEDLNRRLAAGEIIASCDEVSGGGSLKQAEVTGMVDASPERVWEVITDINYFQNFMPKTLKSRAVTVEKLQEVLKAGCNEAKEVEALIGPVPPHPSIYRIPGQKYVLYLYSLLDFPWPLCNRWYIVKIINDETQAAQHIYTSSWTLEIGNLRENRGEWRLSPFPSGQTLVAYRLFTDPGGSVPEFLVKQGTMMTLPQIINSIRKRVAQLPPPPANRANQ
jgi:hypothetical protein